MDETLYENTVSELMKGPKVLRDAVKVLCANRDAWKTACQSCEQKMEIMTRKLDSILNDPDGIVYREFNTKNKGRKI